MGAVSKMGGERATVDSTAVKMKHVGLIGSGDDGLLCDYVRIINSEVRLRRGSRHSATFTLHNVDLHEGAALLRADDWSELVDKFSGIARVMVSGGVEGLAICGSAFSPIAREVGRLAGVPVINMGYSMAKTMEMFRYRRAVVLGTQSSREDRIWKDDCAGLELIGLSTSERDWFAHVLDVDLTSNSREFQSESNRVVASLRKRGVQAVVLANGGLDRWVNLEESLLPVFDSAEIHAWATAAWALAGEGQMLSAPPCVVRD